MSQMVLLQSFKPCGKNRWADPTCDGPASFWPKTFLGLGEHKKIQKETLRIAEGTNRGTWNSAE